MSKLTKNALRILLPFLVLAVAALAAKRMIDMRVEPEKKAMVEAVTTVETAASTAFSGEIMIKAGGTVLPSQKIELRPQVTGQIVSMSPHLQPGGIFKKGALLARIDARDYEFALQQRQAELERARFELTNEKGLSSIAAKEWELLGDQVEATELGRDLTLRKPHLRRAQASLKAAESMLAQAELNLNRTEIRAPFNAQIQMENVDLGQLVNAQTMIVTLTGTDQYWIQVSVPVDQIGHVRLPDREGRGGAGALISHRSGDTIISREGKIVRLLPDLEQAGRMARLLVAVDNPLGNDGELPLMLNAYVTVKIMGKPLADAIAVPATALREGNKVWVMQADDRLAVRAVDVVWQEPERVMVRGELAVDERVITSRIATPVPGMKLKLQEAADAAEDAVAGGGR